MSTKGHKIPCRHDWVGKATPLGIVWVVWSYTNQNLSKKNEIYKILCDFDRQTNHQNPRQNTRPSIDKKKTYFLISFSVWGS